MISTVWLVPNGGWFKINRQHTSFPCTCAHRGRRAGCSSCGRLRLYIASLSASRDNRPTDMESARDARRRRILERGTDRLAFITGQARSVPDSSPPPSPSAPPPKEAHPKTSGKISFLLFPSFPSFLYSSLCSAILPSFSWLPARSTSQDVSDPIFCFKCYIDIFLVDSLLDLGRTMLTNHLSFETYLHLDALNLWWEESSWFLVDVFEGSIAALQLGTWFTFQRRSKRPVSSRHFRK